jgi:hypothetical protein
MARDHVLPELQKRLKQNPVRALAVDGPARICERGSRSVTSLIEIGYDFSKGCHNLCSPIY